MGYRITTINNLPSTLHCYLFLTGDYSTSTMANDLLRDSFDHIADRLGEHGGIIQSTHNSRMDYELQEALHNCIMNEKAFGIYKKMYQKNEPALIITRKHPANLTKGDSVLIISLITLDKSYNNSSELLMDLLAYANNENNNLISKLKIKNKRKIIKGFSFSINLGVFAFNIEL